MAESNQAEKIAVVGVGIMGQGIAQLAAQAGFPVQLYDIDRARIDGAIKSIGGILKRNVEKGKLAQAEYDATVARLAPVTDIAELRGATIVIEAIVENLELKQKTFQALEAAVTPDCILATNTSSLLVTSIAAACQRPERVGGLHFFNPVPLMRVVEVIPGARTAPAVVTRLRDFVVRTKHTPVVASDSPGFLVNHAGRGFYTEGLRIVSEGIAETVDVDRVMREVAGFRMGPFELFDLTGLDVSFQVLQQIYRQFFEEPRFRPVPLVQRQHAAGLYGRKVGRGFYAYDDGTAVVPPEKAPAAHEPRTVWLGAKACDPSLRERLTKLGIAIDDGATARPDSILLVSPLGCDATTTALGEGLDPERTVAVDTLLPITRWTVMTTSVTQPALRDSLHGMLLAGGAKVTMIHDSPGFIAPRVLATIINIASDIAQQRIATPDDIDLAVRIGLGYPDGPLALGDRIGPDKILAILEAMQDFYGDPRYRASPWLKRRARLGRSLKTPES